MAQPPYHPSSPGFAAGPTHPGVPGSGPAPFPPGGFAPGQQPSGPFPPGAQPPGPFPPGPPHPFAAPGGNPVARFAAMVTTARIAAVILVALGLSIPFDSSCSWVTQTAWSAFAMIAAIVQLLPAFAGSFGWSVPRAWLVSATGTGALLLFWLLIVLPQITSNAGFCLTLAAAAATAGTLLAPGRRW